MNIFSKGLVLSLFLSLGFSGTSFGMSRLGAGLISGVKRGVIRRPVVAMAIAGTTAAGLGATNIAWSKNANAENNPLRSILIDKSKQNWRISEDCKDLTIPKGVDGCEVEIDARVRGNVTIDADRCTLKLLDRAAFGESSQNSTVTFSGNVNSFNGNVGKFNGHVVRGNVINARGGTVTIINGTVVIRGSGRVEIGGDIYNITSHEDGAAYDSAGTTFYVNGAHAHIVASASKWLNKALNASVVVTGDHAHIETDVRGSVTVKGQGCKIDGRVYGGVIGDVTGSKANDTTKQTTSEEVVDGSVESEHEYVLYIGGFQ